MATIEQRKNSWRVKVYTDGKFTSRSFRTEALAKAYAETTKDIVRGINAQRRLMEDHRIVNYLPTRFRAAVEKANYSVDEILLCQYPASSISGVYFLIRENKIKYVGQTVNLFHRLGQHKRAEKRFDAFSFIPCEPEHLNELEQIYRDLLMPDENKY